MLIDTHCHLDFPEFRRDRDKLIQQAKEEGIDYIINIGSSLKGSEQSVELAHKYENIYASVGIHPHQADRFNKKEETAIRALAKEKKVVAIGESGLDYYRNYSKAENQRFLFESLLAMAKDYNLPLVIHTRQAQADTLEILKQALPLEAVVHCFCGDEDFLRQCLGLGFYISFTCNITYKKAGNLRRLVELAPLDKILLETDAPFLPPEGLRGRRNEPAYLKYLAKEIAEIKQADLATIAEVTTNNAKKFFKIDPPSCTKPRG